MKCTIDLTDSAMQEMLSVSQMVVLLFMGADGLQASNREIQSMLRCNKDCLRNVLSRLYRLGKLDRTKGYDRKYVYFLPNSR